MQYTLDDIKAAAEKKYASMDITIEDEKVTLVNALRLSKQKRDALTATQDAMGEDGDAEVDQVERLRDAVRIVAATDKQADLLLDAIGDDLALLATIFETYAKGTESGEA